jgi:hypothetical protein
MAAIHGTTAAALGLLALSLTPRAEAGDAPLLPAPPRPAPPVYVIAPPPPEPEPEPEAEPEPRGERAERTLHDGGAEVALGTTLSQLSLGGTFFDGAGTPRGSRGRESFHHAGSELGLRRPVMWSGELSVSYLRRYFAIGLAGFVAGNPSGADATPAPSNGLAASQVSPSGLLAYGGGVDLAAAAPLGPVDVRAGALFGLRGFSLPMSGFEQTTCTRKGRTYACDETATTSVEMVLQPRVRIAVSASGGVFVGAMVGLDVTGGAGPIAGLFVGLHTPHVALRP